MSVELSDWKGRCYGLQWVIGDNDAGDWGACQATRFIQKLAELRTVSTIRIVKPAVAPSLVVNQPPIIVLSRTMSRTMR